MLKLPDQTFAELFIAWCLALSKERLHLEGVSGAQVAEGWRTYTLNDSTGISVVLSIKGSQARVDSVDGADRKVVESVVEDALDRTVRQDLGAGVVYRVVMTLGVVDLGSGGLHFMRTLNDLVHVDGSRRLADAVIFDFGEEWRDVSPETARLMPPASEVQATLYVPGPCFSPYSTRLAGEMAEFAAAVCAFATGRPVQYQAPLFPANQEDTDRAEERRFDAAIPGLARDHVSLDVFGDLPRLGGADAQRRVRGALLAYRVALDQQSSDVAVMLLVTCIEALIAPTPTWGRDRVVARFIAAVLELSPDAVTGLLTHEKIAETFDFQRRGGDSRQAKDLLEAIYRARSTPSHTGLGYSQSGIGIIPDARSMRVALLSRLSKAAVLAYLQAPRSFLVGEPAIDAAFQQARSRRSSGSGLQ